MYWLNKLGLFFVLFSFPLLSFASSPAMPNWQSVGKARLTVLWFDIYDAELFTPTGHFEQHSDLKLSLRYLRNFDAEDLIEETFKQMQPTPAKEQISSWQQQLATIWPNVKENDQLTFVIEGQLGHFFFNGDHVGSINDAVFNKRFADIWLSDNSNYPELAAQLKGLPND